MDVETGATIDMESAVSSIADGLGLDPAPATDNDPGEDHSDDELPEKKGEPEADLDEDKKEADSKADPKADPNADSEKKDPPPAETKIEAPATWRAEAKGEWEKIPAVVQQEIIKREEDIHNGIAQYKDTAEIGKALKSVVAPHLQLLQSQGINPLVQIDSLLKAHVVLSTAPQEQKAQLFQQLAQEYGVTLAEPGEAPYQDPQIKPLQDKITLLESRLNEGLTSQANTKRSEITASVEAFAADPKNIHFNAVANDIVTLIKSGVAGTVAEAYEKAIWLNPIIRAKEQERLATESAAKKAQEEQEKAELAAKTSAANVKTRERSGKRDSEAPGSIDDTLKETYKKINKK